MPDMSDLAEMLFRGRPEDDDEDRPARDPAIEAEVFRDLAKSFLAPQPAFRVGDVVTWKEPALRNARFDVGIVVEVVHEAEPQTEEDGGHFREVYDLCLLIRPRDDGDAVTIGADSRRLRLMTEDELRIVSPAWFAPEQEAA